VELPYKFEASWMEIEYKRDRVYDTINFLTPMTACARAPKSMFFLQKKKATPKPFSLNVNVNLHHPQKSTKPKINILLK
jgi:hypothetical protein